MQQQDFRNFFSVPEDESLEAFCSPLIDTANFNNIVKKKKRSFIQEAKTEEKGK